MSHIVFNIEKRRPGCVLLQAAMGGDCDFLMRHFPSETWLTESTGMQRFTTDLTDTQLKQLVMMAIAAAELTARERAWQDAWRKLSEDFYERRAAWRRKLREARALRAREREAAIEKLMGSPLTDFEQMVHERFWDEHNAADADQREAAFKIAHDLQGSGWTADDVDAAFKTLREKGYLSAGGDSWPRKKRA